MSLTWLWPGTGVAVTVYEGAVAMALGPHAAWTSPDGRSWRLGPGVAPLAGGDRVQALTQTPGGFAAVGPSRVG